ncbi:uncharacterized protein SOCE26_106410 [Sorangium cellulosum]|uniref:Uncharacterized protein n=1 Tax=Sorangium cellulosum TaxID=56 RepID=A0A2L0FBW5_SORCE|nr:DUF5522 domain-containing protein [Sorangium cellulosum]AUX49096.1 uncharacterized protein SOCE26_106410 [Sorangium cellulosum]
MRGPKPPKLIEGEDYYLEGGRLVFTEAYHLKRGYCCNSKCRHCPYREEAPATQPVPVTAPRIKLL